MLRTLVCVVSLCITVQGSFIKRPYPRQVVKTLIVDNGGQWGDWYDPEFCPEGTFASGYNMKIEPRQGNVDDTSLNAISLQCEDATRTRDGGQVQSGSGPWGVWVGLSSCTFQTGPQDFLTAFSLQVESPQGISDDTAANYVKFMCRDIHGHRNQYVMVHPPGHGFWGSYGGWSEACPTNSVICGIQTRVEAPQGYDKDDTALNDVRFFCCT